MTEHSAPQPSAAGTQAGARDLRTAVRNGLRLGASLLGTWAVALLLRFLLPRFLGPEKFGALNFAEAFSGTFFVLAGFGLDTYISKEVPVRPAHASDFFGSALLLRLLMGVALTAGLLLTLDLTHRPESLRWMVVVFAAAQLLTSINASLAALLHANATIDGLAKTNLAAKLIWGATMVVCLWLRAPLVAFAGALVFSELLKSVALTVLLRRELALRFTVNLPVLRRVLAASAPFYLNAIVLSLNSRLDITLLEFLTGDSREVGWYSAAANLGAIVGMLIPLLSWVVLPLLSRAAARSTDELWEIVRRALEGIYLLTVPVSLLAFLGADTWVRLLFGPAYEPAAQTLRAFSPIFMLTYIATLLSMTLAVLNQGWTLTLISCGGVVINVALTLLLVPLGARLLGTGGAGVGDALAVLGMELIVTTVLLLRFRGRAFDARTIRSLLRSLVPCAATIAVHFGLSGLGPARLLADCVAYLSVALLAGAPHPAEVRALWRQVRSGGGS